MQPSICTMHSGSPCPRIKSRNSEITSAGYREELGVFLRLWLVILAGVAVILLSSWLVTG